MATPYTLQRLYSPSKKYETILTLWDNVDDLDDEQYYKLLITDVILADGDYEEILNIEVPQSISSTTAECIIKDTIVDFLNHCDDLPVYPSVSDCINQFRVPDSFVLDFVNQYNDENILLLLPTTARDEITKLYEEKLKQLFEEVKQKNKNGYYLQKVSLADLQIIFSVLADNRTSSSDLFNDEILIEEVKSFFHSDFEEIIKYKEFIQNKGTRDKSNLLIEIKAKKISQLDAVIYTLKSFF